MGFFLSPAPLMPMVPLAPLPDSPFAPFPDMMVLHEMGVAGAGRGEPGVRDRQQSTEGGPGTVGLAPTRSAGGEATRVQRCKYMGKGFWGEKAPAGGRTLPCPINCCPLKSNARPPWRRGAARSSRNAMS